MTGSKKIHGVVSVSIEAYANKLVARFDPHLTTREHVIAAVEAVVDSIE